MADPFMQINLSGNLFLIEQLRNLPKRMANGAIRFALRDNAKPILISAKLRAPRDKGDLEKSLRIKAFRRTRKGRIGFTIGTSSLASAYQGKQFYGASRNSDGS